jgi:hypothetical protein
MFSNWLLHNKKIQISNDLYQLLIGVWHDRLSPGGIVISYLAARNFDVVRFPTRPDRAVDGKGNRYLEAVKILDGFTDNELRALADELKQITQQTQTILLELCSSDHVLLERAVAPMDSKTNQYLAANRQCDQIELFPMLALAAKMAGQSSISLDFDIVSGWSTSSIQRYGTLHITRSWPIGNILLVSDLLSGPKKLSLSIGPLESNEWLCVNTNSRGMLEVPTTNVKVVGLLPKYSDTVTKHSNVLALANELQEKAYLAPTERGIAARPSNLRLRNPPPVFGANFISRIRNALSKSSRQDKNAAPL